MNALQNFLDRINEKFGAVGSVLMVVFWLVVLFFALRFMIQQT